MNDQSQSRLPLWMRELAAVIIAMCITVALISAAWFNVNSQMSELKLELHVQVEDVRSDIKVLQNKVAELDKDEAKLTERIAALVASYNARNTSEAGGEQDHAGRHRK